MGLILGAATLASATPALPSASVALQAIQTALAPVKAASTPVAAPVTSAQSAAAARAAGIQLAQGSARSTGRSAVVRSTAYNSTPGQTDNSPYITATGTRVRFGTVALSRDLLRRFPYGSKITIEDLSGRYNALLKGRIFVVEDTMHPRMVNTVDVWMGTRSEALQWGTRNIRITAVN
ncbi:hypothetical protein [Deinococcus sonorensis]|uniref:3D domain-containing protein n=2 Tax=Deinococcus sonorensis TaxID=309891 RepID=A0AAU7UCL0_9DEIO